ncbi:MAG: hypothetical protein RLZZ536_400 [Planctomycetota bacterium]|jgi:hypothetical protein
MNKLRLLGWLLLLPFLAGEECAAQGLKISTQIRAVDPATPDGEGTVVSSSLTLCHNGRIFDYVALADELCVFDPVQKHFVVASASRRIQTRVTFDEIRHHTETRRLRTEEYLQEMSAGATTVGDAEIQFIRFQLNPEFRQSFEPAGNLLVLASPALTYRIELCRWEDAEQVDRCLTWRDWTARLNSVLHPDNLFPEPRLEVNRAIRERGGSLPVVVELDRRPAVNTVLRAEHQITTGLSDDDHSRIAKWESMLRSQDLQTVPLRRYQQTALVSRNR